MVQHKALSRGFYERDTKLVAEALLGKVLVRRLGGEDLRGIIVETEAYYGEDDPASRAYHGLKGFNAPMWADSGSVFIYNVHNNWMLNIVAHMPGGVGAVLVRAIEPIGGIETMKENRGVAEIRKVASGPGRLSKALKVDKSFNGASVISAHSGLFVVEHDGRFETARSHRIGVKADLAEELRFYIRGNRFVSR